MKWIVGILVLGIGLYIGYSCIDRFDVEMVRGKRVLVTGASAGIGEQMAYHYASMGAKLLITARTESKLQKVIAHCREVGDLDGDYRYLIADMADINSYEEVIKAAESAFGGLDFLVLNHISATPFRLWLGKPEDLTFAQHAMDVNFRAYIHLASHALPLLEKSRGSIVVVSSMAGKLGMPYHISYSASKFALDGFFSGLRLELRLRKIDVSVTLCVLGYIGTESAVQRTGTFGASYQEKVSPASPSDTAVAIIKGGALRYREVFYPFPEAKLSLLRDIFTSILENQILYIFA